MSDQSKKKKSTSALKAKNTLRKNSVISISGKGFHRIAYRDWGRVKSPETVFCLHGLTRNAYDFDNLAKVLSVNRRVICPDIVGRGNSDWLPSHEDYNLPQYNLDIAVLAAKTARNSNGVFDLIGTSLGGLMGIILASMQNSPVKRLVINDIAPEVPYSALKRLSQYLGEDPFFDNLVQAEAYLREKYAPFSPMSDKNWRRMTKHSTRKSGDGFRLAYDPAISENYRRYWLLMYFSLWNYWDKINCPVLILRGKESDFLTEPLLSRMTDALPHADVVEFDGVGHTPSLNSAEQINSIVNWLNK